MRPGVKILLLLVVGAVLYFAFTFGSQRFGIGISKARSVNQGKSLNLPELAEAPAEYQNVKPVEFPKSSTASVRSTLIPIDIWEWNAYQALILANGGAKTTKGSLMEKYNVNLLLKRQDSNKQMGSDLLSCANELHGGSQTCGSGVAAIVVMGDSGGQWLADLNPQLKKLGDEYALKIIGAVGRSNGEDSLLGPKAWRDNPQSMKGAVIAGVIRDGDWNIALNYEAANGLKNNPDLKTYDPDAVNWVSAHDEDYIKAVTEQFAVTSSDSPDGYGVCEARKVVKDGRPTGETKKVCVDGVVTWLPGDELAIHGKPGTVKVISSRQYSSQMPSVIICIKKFCSDNRDQVAGLLAATFEAADQIKAFDSARRKAGELSAKVYGDEGGNDPLTNKPYTNGEYWYKYYPGITDPKTGEQIGGSAVFGIEDNLRYFGLNGQFNNNMKATYEMFARIDTEQYPELFKDKNAIPPYKDAVDTSYIFGAQSLLSSGGVQAAPVEQVSYAAAKESGTVRGRRPYYISFNTGSDVPLPDGLQQLSELKDQLAVNEALAISIEGYTDNTGSDAVNVPLSQRRAKAVEAYLQRIAPQTFRSDRFKTVKGYGSQNPRCQGNGSPECKAENRRVEIVQWGGQ
jgi:outer membrane protein OmpA-like peptidoglycan-associated protein